MEAQHKNLLTITIWSWRSNLLAPLLKGVCVILFVSHIKTGSPCTWPYDISFYVLACRNRYCIHVHFIFVISRKLLQKPTSRPLFIGRCIYLVHAKNAAWAIHVVRQLFCLKCLHVQGGVEKANTAQTRGGAWEDNGKKRREVRKNKSACVSYNLQTLPLVNGRYFALINQKKGVCD